MMQWMAERFFYLPFVFLLILFAKISKEIILSKKMKMIIKALASLTIIILFFISVNRTPVWESDLTVGKEMLKHNPYSFPGIILMLNYNERNQLFNANIKLLNNLKYSKDSKSDWYKYYYYNAKKNI